MTEAQSGSRGLTAPGAETTGEKVEDTVEESDCLQGTTKPDLERLAGGYELG